MYIMHIGVLLACVSVPCVPGAMGARRRHQDSWDLELQIVSCHVVGAVNLNLGSV